MTIIASIARSLDTIVCFKDEHNHYYEFHCAHHCPGKFIQATLREVGESNQSCVCGAPILSQIEKSVYVARIIKEKALEIIKIDCEKYYTDEIPFEEALVWGRVAEEKRGDLYDRFGVIVEIKEDDFGDPTLYAIERVGIPMYLYDVRAGMFIEQ